MINLISNSGFDSLGKLKNFLTLKGIEKETVDKYNHVIMIHEVSLELLQYFKFNKELFFDCIFTFDDGLYSQYRSFEKFNILFPNNPKFYFVSTGIICKEKNFKQKRWIDCREAHRAAFEDDNLNAYMKRSQIIDLSKNDNVYIGGHGCNHLHILGNKKLKLKERYLNWMVDFKRMVQWFKVSNLDLTIYCTPYNEYSEIFHGGAKKYFPDIKIIGPNRNTPIGLVKLKKGL
jgi:hypothetical protein